MQLGANADSALLQRALDGQEPAAPGIAGLVSVAREIEALDQRGLAPRADFVAELRQRLLDEPVGTSGDAPPAVDDTRPSPTAVVRFGRRARVLVAAAALLLVLAGGLGVLSRAAVPGDRLYPVKQLLDRVALDLRRDTVPLGLTHLAQAREHVSDAEQLLARAPEGPIGTAVDTEPDTDLSVALEAATASSSLGRSVLLDAYRLERRGDALTSLADFYAQTLPAVDALRTYRLPPMATTAWQRLHDVLEQGRDDTLRELAACTICGAASDEARALLARESPAPSTTGPSATTAPGTTPSPSGDDGATAPLPTSGTTDADGSGTTASPGGAVRLPSVGVTSTSLSVGGGGVTLPDPLPTVSLPGAGVNTSGVTLGGGGVTLPGATVSVPIVTVPLPQPKP